MRTPSTGSPGGRAEGMSWAKLTLLLQESGLGQPLLESQHPTADRPGVGRTEPEAVAAGAVHVQLRWCARAFEPQVDLGQTFGDVLTIVVGRGEKRGRGVLGRLNVHGSSGIDQRLEGRPRRLPLDRIRCI